MRGDCIKYNVIETQQNQDIMIKEFKNLAHNLNETDMFHVHNMTKEDINFSEITSSVISFVNKQLELLTLYFSSMCYHPQEFNSHQHKVITHHDFVSHERCLQLYNFI